MWSKRMVISCLYLFSYLMIEELLQVRCFNQLIGTRLSLTSNPLMALPVLIRILLVRTIENRHPMRHWHNIDNNNNLSDVGVRNATNQRCGFCGNQISHGYIKRDQTNEQKKQTQQKQQTSNKHINRSNSKFHVQKKSVSTTLPSGNTDNMDTYSRWSPQWPEHELIQGGISLIVVLMNAQVGLWGNGIPIYPIYTQYLGGTLFYPVPHDTK